MQEKSKKKGLFTKQRRLDPVAVAHLEETILAVVRLKDVNVGDVEDDALAVRCGNSPLAEFTLGGW